MQRKYIIRQRRISYRVSDISLKNELHYGTIHLDKLEFGEVMDVCSNKKKMIAPIIITVIMVLYYVVYFGFLITLLPSIWKYALGIIPLGFSVVMVKVCIERINEIKKGEEDDISKY